jgi:uncharacterized protein YmfQ (DUF2313 family)
MTITSCDAGGGSGLQGNFCPTTVDEALPAILGLLPEGPAWDAAHQPGTMQNSFWRGVAGIVAYVNKRMCDWENELFPDTATETHDQWAYDFGLGDDCDPWGTNLVAKVTAQGGQDCATFVRLAREMNWVIECDDIANEPECVVGCFECGCTMLGPTPVLFELGSNVGCGFLGDCNFGSVVDHPQPEFWNNALTSKADCRVPGSNLGYGPDADEGCCMICGYYEWPDEADTIETSYCTTVEDTIYFDCPTPSRQVGLDTTGCDQTTNTHIVLDSTGNYSEWGNAFVWRVIVDMEASRALQGLSQVAPLDENVFNAGNIQAGCSFVDTDVNPLIPLTCFLQKYKPAHTELFVEMINT